MSIIRSRNREPQNQPNVENTPQMGASGDPRVTTSTYIDPGCELSGNLKFSEMVKVDGRIEGEVECEKIIIGEPAAVNSSLRCESLDVFGELHGEVEAKRMVRIYKSAHVTAQIKTGSVVIEEGSRFKGLIEVGCDESAKPAKSPAGTPPAAKPSDSDAPAK